MVSVGGICQQYLKDYLIVFPNGDATEIQKRLAQIESKFKNLDEDGSGDLDLDEIAKALPTVKSKEEIKDVLSLVDDDNSGTLRLREFINFILIHEGVITAPIPEIIPAKVVAGGGRRVGAMKKKKRGHLKIKLSLRRTAEGYDLVVDILEAKELLPMDFNGKADPFVKMYVLPDPKKKSKRKTKTIKCSLAPKWGESFVWQVPSSQVASSTVLKETSLRISMFDWDRITQNDFMGQMTFSLEEISQAPIEGWYMLLDETQGSRYNFRSRDQEHSVDEVYRAPSAQATSPPTPSTSTLAESDLQYFKVLGRGNFGKVLLAENKKNHSYVAVKVLKKSAIIEDNDPESTMTERQVFSVANGCPFLAHLLATFQSPANLFFVMELYSGGDLMFQVLNHSKLSEAATSFYVAEICIGLWYLHSHHIFYRDLKLDNVLLDADGHVRIADFGLCKDLSKSDAKATNTFCGTPNYLAPEIVKNDYYGSEVDWWSLGVMIYEMMTGNVLFDADNEDKLYHLIVNQPINLSRSLSPESRSIISGFLSRDPKKRLGFGPSGKEAIRGQSFFKFNWQDAEARRLVPPLVPTKSADPRAAVNFDSEFTSEKPVVTPTNAGLVARFPQEIFRGFSFTAQSSS